MERAAPVLPAGRLVEVRGGREAGASPDPDAVPLELGALRETLTVEGQPLADLPAGTRLRLGATAVVELLDEASADAGGGLREAEGESASVPARVVTPGLARVGDPVVIEAVAVPLEDALDLHFFRPEEIPEVVTEYLVRAAAAGLDAVRLIHGRGRGVQRAVVRRLLAASPVVAAFRDAPPERGGWGATLVRLRAGSPPPGS